MLQSTFDAAGADAAEGSPTSSSTAPSIARLRPRRHFSKLLQLEKGRGLVEDVDLLLRQGFFRIVERGVDAIRQTAGRPHF